MKLVIPSLLAVTLSTLSLSAAATQSLLGEMVRPISMERPILMALPTRTIQLTVETKYVNVNHGEIIRFVSSGREFTWYFDGFPNTAPFDLTEIAPGFPATGVTVYVGVGDLGYNP